MNINWFPGHMKKTKNLITNNIKLVDIVIEILDARIPYSSKNPDIESLTNGKKIITVLNKADLADSDINNKWIQHYQNHNKDAILLNSFNKQNIKQLKKIVNEFSSNKLENQKNKGRKNYAIKVMIVGIPNVGKSTVINQLVNRKAAKTSDKPGVTRGKQWVKLGSELLMLDTPGVLWPKFDDEIVGLNLAYTGAIKDEILDIQTLALKFINTMRKEHSKKIEERYKISINDSMTDLQVYEEIGRKRGFLLKGAEIDYERCAKIILDEFRSGIIGKISLEEP